MAGKKKRLVLLELFAGTRSVGKVAEQLGMQVFSVDILQTGDIGVVCDLLHVSSNRFDRMAPDVIWASPPCTAFSVASLGHHWIGGKKAFEPKTADAYVGMALVKRTQEIIARHPKAIWFMENPRGALRNLPLMQGFGTRHTVTYCQYGDKRMKPTDIWTNCTGWTPKPMCKKGDPCHEAAPRGSRTGTQGIKGAIDRAVIPPALCMDVITSALKQLV